MWGNADSLQGSVCLEAVADKRVLVLIDHLNLQVYQYWPPFAPGPIKEYDVLLPVKSHTVPSGFEDIDKTA